MKVKEVLALFRRVLVKRKYKDILFRFIFKDKKELLQLYNAINNTSYTNPDDLFITTMEDVIYIGMKNDLSFLIANELNLYEHQSTLNRNMPLRGLIYLAKMYESYIETHGLNKYQKKMIPLPFPRFIVFYNGEEEMGEELYLKLSDAFEDREEEPAVECVAKFININYGHNQELMEKCERLNDYSYFVACVRNYLKKGYNQKESVTCAVNECIDKGILKDVLKKHRAEVVDMFLTTFDKKMYEEALREEAREEVREELENEKRLLEEKNAALAQQIDEKTQQIDEKTQQIDAQTQQIDAQTQQIDEQTRMLAEQTKQLEEERRRVAELEALLANKSE